MSKIPFAMIFDMDGTLFQTETVLIPALHKTFERLRRAGEWQGGTPVEEYLRILGVPIPEVWRQLMPEADEEVRARAAAWFLDDIIAEIEQGNGRLYQDVLATLASLADQGIPLFVASNGRSRYLAAIWTAFQLERYFIDCYSLDRFSLPAKSALVKQLLNDYKIESAVMVGDRGSDIQAAKENGLWSIGCLFGFASAEELRGADVIIQQFSEIGPALREIEKRAGRD
ncbi:HAD hydrolase-like protein [Parageobacillus thermoglucosidasius]|uniref:HAD hydrolase-like protein n=1 Tax=Parageobacillus thermoglucosidasius TaxID=1426 RepID=UPI000E163DD3|nr:HAD hydrolase-like protein [Parageobacillus thermoglucosidasius]RDE23644.1 HAD family hydrolase [Parageobacillus thermoglucosidasius]